MSFKDFQFHDHIQKALDAHGYVSPTPVQEQAISPILAGRDLLGLAQTGTGKTAAFVLPILQHLTTSGKGRTKALIISPTRELAEQTHNYIGKFARHLNIRSTVVYGGVSKQTQIQRLRQGSEIIVACPGRLLDIAADRAVNLSAVDTLVLDEADQMFDKGFLPDIRRIVKLLPVKRQNLVFSATMPQEVRSLVEGMLVDPVKVQVDHNKTVAAISHFFYRLDKSHKTNLLEEILREGNIATAIVFTKTKHKARSLALRLQKKGHKATSLQGNLSQQKRQMALDGFKKGTYNILVATDIAARGIDVTGISHVINYDMPGTAEAYTHRTGRTGRASLTGEAFTFATAEDDRMTRTLERTLGNKLVYRTGTPPHKDQSQEGFTKPAQRNNMAKISQTPKKMRGKRSSQRNRSVSFDFGI